MSRKDGALNLLWRIQRINTTLLLFLVLAVTLLAFIIVPILRLIFASPPEAVASAALDPQVQGALLTTFLASTITTILALFFGVPLAYLLARYDFPSKSLIESVVDIPILIPHTVTGIALLTLFGARGPLGSAASVFGVSFSESLLGVVLAMLFVSAPLMIKTTKETIQSISPELEKVARTLGASPWKVLSQVTLPLAFRGIVTGAILTWARAVSEFGAVVVLAYHPFTAPVLIYARFIDSGLSAALPIASLLVIVALGAFVALKILQYRPIRLRSSRESP